jgi:malate permease and related proteins
MNILTSIENILPIILIIALGFYLNEKGWFGTEFGGNISRLIMTPRRPGSTLKSLTIANATI